MHALIWNLSNSLCSFCRKVQRLPPCAGGEVIKACLSREYILLKRNSFVYVFKAVQVGASSQNPLDAC